jgi:hypothetical protein
LFALSLSGALPFHTGVELGDARIQEAPPLAFMQLHLHASIRAPGNELLYLPGSSALC